MVFALYLVLMILNAMSNAFWWPNSSSVALSLLIGVHYYFSVWHPAMLAQPPVGQWGMTEVRGLPPPPTGYSSHPSSRGGHLVCMTILWYIRPLG